MNRDYIHNGEALPAELLDKIAADVRRFDEAQSPEQRAVKSVQSIDGHLSRIRMELDRANELTTTANRLADRAAIALEVQAAIALGVPADIVRSLISPKTRSGHGFSSVLVGALLRQEEQTDG